MKDRINFLLVGVGGQGILTASDIVAEVGLEAGLDAKKSEIHGFSQRGGVVESHVRWAPLAEGGVGSPTAEKGAVDVLIATEMLEAARWIDWLRPGGVVFINRQKITPMSVSAGKAAYPDLQDIVAAVKAQAAKVILIEGLAIAERLGKAQLGNTVLLGALSTQIDVDQAIWLQVIERRVPPKYVELNRVAFAEGRQALPEKTRNT